MTTGNQMLKKESLGSPDGVLEYKLKITNPKHQIYYFSNVWILPSHGGKKKEKKREPLTPVNQH